MMKSNIQKKIKFFLLILCFSLLWTIAQGEENLLVNGDFSQVDEEGIPLEWFIDAWSPGVEFSLYQGEKIGQNDHMSVSIENLNENDARFSQLVVVQPNTTYRLSGYIQTKEVADSGWGANISIGGIHYNPQGVYGSTEDWTYVESYGITGPNQNTLEVWARLGGYSGESTGKAYFDSLSLVEAPGVPLGTKVDKWYKEVTAADNQGALDNEHEGKTMTLGAYPWLRWGIISLAYILAFLLLYKFLVNKEEVLEDRKKTKKKLARQVLAFGFILSLVIRIILSAQVPGYGTDMNCFISWGNRVATVGTSSFYQPGGEFFCDYPPGYLYILGLTGSINNGLKALGQNNGWIYANYDALARVVIKLIPNLADLLAALLLYRFAKKRMPAMGAALLALLYAFNPVTFLNSAGWGQIDSVLALGLMTVVLLALEKKWTWVLPAYVLSVLIKPQALMFGPLGLSYIVFALVWEKDPAQKKKNIKSLLWGLGLSIITAGVVIIPFHGNQPGNWLMALYADTLGSYDYATLNTANFFYLLGGNWAPSASSISNKAALLVGIFALMLISLSAWLYFKNSKQSAEQGLKGKEVFFQSVPLMAMFVTGVVYGVFALTRASFGLMGNFALAGTIVWAVYLLFKGRDLANLPIIGGVMLLAIYVFAGKMHERYLYPALILLFLAYAYKRDYRILPIIGVSTLTTFFNVAIILFSDMNFEGNTGHLPYQTHGINQLIAFANVFIALYALWVATTYALNQNEGFLKTTWPKIKPESYEEKNLRDPSNHSMGFGKKDWLIVLGTTIVYSVLTFTNLGSTVAPQSKWTAISPQEAVIFDLNTSDPYKMLYYYGPNENNFMVYTSSDGQTWGPSYEGVLYQEGKSVPCYKWDYLSDAGEKQLLLRGRYVKIVPNAPGVNLFEIIFRDEAGNLLSPIVKDHLVPQIIEQGLRSQSPQALIDEQNTLTGEPGWYNSTYFDEIYHARTGYEHLHNQPPYEWTHPPLGKILISWAIGIFGMTPFGWRFAGALVGVLMLPGMYLLTKQLTKKRSLATGAMLLMTFDLMHFTQTRIATIDSYPVLFIILAYWAMIRYMQTDVYAVSWSKRLIPLFLSGTFIGLAVASKWTGAYAAVGLALLFFWSSWRNLSTGIKAAKLLDEKSKNKGRLKAGLLEKSGQQQPFEQQKLERAANQHIKIFLTTCLWCIFFFVIIPFIIYCISYIPHFAPNGGFSFTRLISEQKRMLSYHSTPGLGMDHPYYSPWWEWPIIKGPMWYFSTRSAPEGMGSTIVAMGNPVVWWLGLAAFLMVAAAFVKRHLYIDDQNMLLHFRAKTDYPAIGIVLIGLASQFLPWVLVPRGTYIYHYFASVPFIILCIVLVIDWLGKKHPNGVKILLWSVVILALGAFILYFPFASGLTVSKNWLSFGEKIFPFRLPY